MSSQTIPITSETITATNSPRAERAENNKSFNEALRQKLKAYKLETGFTDKELGRVLGRSSTAVNLYLNGNPVGDVAGLENNIEDFLERVGIQGTAPVVIKDNVKLAVQDVVTSALNKIQRTTDFGLIVGPAGCGKTHSKAVYLASHPTAVGIDIRSWSHGMSGVEELILEQLPKRGLSEARNGFDFIARKLRGSNRLLIVDGAHKLTNRGFECLFDLHDDAGIPIALIGNPVMESKIKGLQARLRERNEQHVSRIGSRTIVKPKYDPAEIKGFIGLYLPEPASSRLISLAAHVANNAGHLRCLRKVLLLTVDLLPDTASDVEAFQLAHTQIVTDVTLNG